ncbi:MAG TPA: hypothetical protein PK466_12145, partial [Thermotogota bacterium]|nr:hypothetical protein [Thermotogota bacterium]HPR97076.1 hypothetical protein [Thermotogota bacterium]
EKRELNKDREGLEVRLSEIESDKADLLTKKKELEQIRTDLEEDMDKLRSETKRLKLMLLEKDELLNQEMKNLVDKKDENEMLKYENMRTLSHIEELKEKIAALEKKLNGIGSSTATNDTLEQIRLMTISNSLQDKKPTE